jgi:glutaminyl-tRNA synthetase
MQREYGRLNLKSTVMSKRDIRSLIETKTVRGWDDPRLYTLKGIRRRGIPPGALLAFVSEPGVSTANTPSRSSASSNPCGAISSGPSPA